MNHNSISMFLSRIFLSRIRITLALTVLSTWSLTCWTGGCVGCFAQESTSKVDKKFENLSAQDYQAAIDKWSAAGYLPVEIDVSVVRGKDLYTVAFRYTANSTDYRCGHLMPHASYIAKDKELAKLGYKREIHKTYSIGRDRRHLAVWIRESKSDAIGTIWNSIEDVPSTGNVNDDFQSLDKMMEKFIFENQVPGATIAVSYEGEIVYERGFGYSDLENRIAMSPNTRMRIASISKPITAVAVMRLVDQGKLSLDDKAFERLSLSPVSPATTIDPNLNEITVLQLLRHRGGWDREASFDPMFRQKMVADYVGKSVPVKPHDIIRFMMSRKLDFAPGQKYAYSNFGYSVLGRLIEEVTGKEYSQYVQEELLKPLGIKTMKIGKTKREQRDPRETYYYTRDGKSMTSLLEPDKQVTAPYGQWHLESFDSHGGWISSAADLVRFVSAFDDPANCPLLTESAINTMFLPPHDEPTVNGTKRLYGCGWSIVSFNNGDQFNAYHMGLLAGTSTITVRRHDGYCWTILFNIDRSPSGTALSSEIDSLVHRAIDMNR